MPLVKDRFAVMVVNARHAELRPAAEIRELCNPTRQRTQPTAQYEQLQWRDKLEAPASESVIGVGCDPLAGASSL